MLTRDYINRVSTLLYQTSHREIGCMESGDKMSKTFKLSDDVWMAAVQVFQLAMFTQQDVSDVFQSLEVCETDDGRLDLTDESKKLLEESMKSFVPTETSPVDDDAESHVFVIGKGD